MKKNNRAERIKWIGCIVALSSWAVPILLTICLPKYEILPLFWLTGQLAVGILYFLSGMLLGKGARDSEKKVSHPFQILGWGLSFLFLAGLALCWALIAGIYEAGKATTVLLAFANLFLIASAIAFIVRFFKKERQLHSEKETRLPYYFLFTIWGFFLLGIVSLRVPGVLTAVFFSVAFLSAIAMSIAVRITKVDPKNTSFFRWTDALIEQMDRMDQKTYENRKSHRNTCRTIGIILGVCAVLFYSPG